MCLSTFEVLGQENVDSYDKRRYKENELENRKLNGIKTNVLPYAMGDFNITYERLSRHAPRSFLAKFDYIVLNTNRFSLSGVTLRAGLRTYLTKKRLPPAGYFVEPFFIYGDFTAHNNLSGAHLTEKGGGIVGGKQWAIGGRFTIEIFIGGGYADVATSNGKVQNVINSVLILLGANAGFRF